MKSALVLVRQAVDPVSCDPIRLRLFHYLLDVQLHAHTSLFTAPLVTAVYMCYTLYTTPRPVCCFEKDRFYPTVWKRCADTTEVTTQRVPFSPHTVHYSRSTLPMAAATCTSRRSHQIRSFPKHKASDTAQASRLKPYPWKTRKQLQGPHFGFGLSERAKIQKPRGSARSEGRLTVKVEAEVEYVHCRQTAAYFLTWKGVCQSVRLKTCPCLLLPLQTLSFPCTR